MAFKEERGEKETEREKDINTREEHDQGVNDLRVNARE